MSKYDPKPGDPVCVEQPQPDGSYAMYLGELVGIDLEWIVLDRVTWVYQTGRRHLFFAGDADSTTQWEVQQGEQLLPRWGCRISRWQHALPTESK